MKEMPNPGKVTYIYCARFVHSLINSSCKEMQPYPHRNSQKYTKTKLQHPSVTFLIPCSYCKIFAFYCTLFSKETIQDITQRLNIQWSLWSIRSRMKFSNMLFNCLQNVSKVIMVHRCTVDNEQINLFILN